MRAGPGGVAIAASAACCAALLLVVHGPVVSDVATTGAVAIEQVVLEPEVLIVNGPSIREMALSSDGSTIAIGEFAGSQRPVNRIRLFDAITGDSIGTLHSSSWWGSALAFTRDGRCLASAALDGAVRLWDLQTLSLTRVLYASAEHSVEALAFSPDGRTLLGAIGPMDSVAVVWDTANPVPNRRFGAHSMGLWDADWSRDGRWIVTSSHDGSVAVFDAERVEPVSVFQAHRNKISAIALSPNGRFRGVDRRVAQPGALGLPRVDGAQHGRSAQHRTRRSARAGGAAIRSGVDAGRTPRR